MLEPRAVMLAFGLRHPDRDHLGGVVPFIDRGRDVESLIALQPDQATAERLCQDLGDFGLADAGLPFKEQRTAHAQRQEQNGCERTVSEIVGSTKQIERCVDRARQRLRRLRLLRLRHGRHL